MPDRQGFFEMARGGTIFLDEIGELSPSLQVKLLRVIQERTFRRIGGAEDIKVDVRIISATHQNLGEKSRRGNFAKTFITGSMLFPFFYPH